jgi:uncharacterized protein YeaO (DUF488 family)
LKEPGVKERARRLCVMIKIKRVYDPPEPEDGKRILIDRLWPRGIKKENLKMDEWLKEIAPSDKLRKWFSHDPKKYEEFKKRYVKELEDKSEILERIRREAKKGRVTILFSAKDTEHNNATVMKELLKE